MIRTKYTDDSDSARRAATRQSELTADGRWFRILTVVDQYTRECPCMYADRSQTGQKVAEQLDRLIALRGAPASITSDNGAAFTGRAMDTWAHQAGVELNFIRPGKPVENGYIESFNGYAMNA